MISWIGRMGAGHGFAPTSHALVESLLPVLAPQAHVVLHSGEHRSVLPPGVHAVVPKGATDALLDHLAAHQPAG